jgi:hypothetical protein
MMTMASWLICKRFQTKMNSKSQMFLDKKGSPPALPYGVQMEKGLISP